MSDEPKSEPDKPEPYSLHEFFKQTMTEDELRLLWAAPCSIDWPKVRKKFPDLPWNEDAFPKGDDQ